MSDTVFGKILRGELPAKIIHEDEHCIAFHDVAPQAPIHVLIIPRRDVVNLDSFDPLSPTDAALAGHLLLVATKLARELGVAESGYRVVTNINEDGGQSVYHLHLHLLAGRPMRWPPG